MADRVDDAVRGEGTDDRAERRRDAARQKILGAAAPRLAEHGYGATSLADVSLLSDVEPAVVSFHFPTVEDLVEAVLRAGIGHARQAINEALDVSDATTGAEQLGVAIDAYLRAISLNEHVTRANIRCYRSVPPVVRRGLAVHMREFVETWTELIGAGMADKTLRPDLDPELAARVLIAALNSTLTRPEENIEATAAQLQTMILGGLRA